MPIVGISICLVIRAASSNSSNNLRVPVAPQTVFVGHDDEVRYDGVDEFVRLKQVVRIGDAAVALVAHGRCFVNQYTVAGHTADNVVQNSPVQIVRDDHTVVAHVLEWKGAPGFEIGLDQSDVSAVGKNARTPAYASPLLAYKETFGTVLKGADARTEAQANANLMDFLVDDVKRARRSLSSR